MTLRSTVQRRMRRVLVCAASLAGLGLGCTTESNDTCDFVDVHLTATQSPALQFSWTPGSCGAYELIVTEGTPIRWLTQATGFDNTLHPPIRYGVHPRGASGPPPDTLTPGFHYIAVLWRGNAARDTAFADTVTFVYQPSN